MLEWYAWTLLYNPDSLSI